MYNIAIRLYYAAVWLAARWNRKAAAWIAGRKSVFAQLEGAFSPTDAVIWMHCSSAGEFEQGKPLLQALRRAYPQHKILLSFFSPSGFAVAGGYPHADKIVYLPLDTRRNARRFMQIVRPKLAVFVKYEFWYHHLAAAAFHHVPVLLVSASFRPNQVFFRPYGGFFRQLLHYFRHIFVQDGASLQLLHNAGVTHSSVSGDTRFDRVAEIAEGFEPLPQIEQWINGTPVVVAGSTWSGDEAVLSDALPPGIKLIIAPHEVNPAHVAEIRRRFQNAVLHSALSEASVSAPVLIIDCVGLLARLYRYASVSYVGGGFTPDGIHNVLEAAVWGCPVVVGPNHAKYREAGELIAAGGGFSVANAAELRQRFTKLLSYDQQRAAAGKAAKAYVAQNRGATQPVLDYIQEKRLLTRL